MAITREDQIEQSVYDFLEFSLRAKGYTEAKVMLREAFPTVNERSQALPVTTIAIGFNFDDGGRQAEIGSDLIQRVYTIEFWVFGTTPTLGRNVAHMVRAIFEENYLVPIKDIGISGQPVIDQLPLLDERGVQVERQIAPDPHAWDTNVWTTTTRFEDYYSPALVE
jgi:hypothetical protein